jgi:hypothetical protein
MSAIDPPEKKRHGCFFYGSIVLLVFVLVVAVAGFFIARYFIGVANATIAKYTETEAMTFPKVEMPAEELRALQQRVAVFNSAMEAHSNTPALVLSSQDINALMASNTNFKDLKDTCYVEIEGDKVKGELSLPLGKYFRFPFVHFKGRYLNGTGTFRVAVSNEALSVYVDSLEVKGKPLPPEFMMQLKGKDMAVDFNKNPSNAATMSHYESLLVTNGTIMVKAMAK